jgi:hypothetical protein
LLVFERTKDIVKKICGVGIRHVVEIGGHAPPPHQQKNPRELCQGSSPNFICSHVPMKIFLFYESRKK